MPLPEIDAVLPRLSDTVELLVGERAEWFKFERAIRLFEFRSWVYWPSDEGIRNRAGLLAAVLMLDQIEDDIFFEEDVAAQYLAYPDGDIGVDLNDKPDPTLYRIQVLRKNETYRRLHDFILAPRGGLQRLLRCPSPEQFNEDVKRRISIADDVCDLVDYQLRQAQHRKIQRELNSHAIFFHVWPTFNLPGKRGVRSNERSLSARTLQDRTQEFKRSAIFVYLNHRAGFSQTPELSSGPGYPMDDIISDADDLGELRRLFGAYAYIAQTIHDAGGDLPILTIPPSVQPVEVITKQFSDSELNTIAAYKDNYLKIRGG
jgi:hypothetical protein